MSDLSTIDTPSAPSVILETFTYSLTDGTVCECVGYGRILSDTERAQITAYFARKYGDGIPQFAAQRLALTD